MPEAAPKKRPFISACFLSFNSEATIEMAVTSIRTHVDEVVIYDTGSRDRTLSLLRALSKSEGTPIRVHRAGAELEPGLFPDGAMRDLSSAREISFSLASPEADWLLWLDHDDDVVIGIDLHELAATAPSHIDAFLTTYELEHDDEGNCTRALYRERLVRRGRLLWVDPVHTMLKPLNDLAYDYVSRWLRLSAEDFRVIHRGGSERDSWKERILRDVECQAALAGDDLDGRTLWYLGRTVQDEDPARALTYLVRAALSGDVGHTRWALFDIGFLLRARGDYWLALLVDGLNAQLLDSVPSLMSSADTLAGLGDLARADKVYLQARSAIESDQSALDDIGTSAAVMLKRIEVSRALLATEILAADCRRGPCKRSTSL